MEDYNTIEYYKIYGVKPNDYTDVSISFLNLSNIINQRLSSCGFITICKLLYATRSNLKSIISGENKQVDLIEKALKAYLDRKNSNNDYIYAEFSESESDSRKSYFKILNVNPDIYSNIDISVLPLTPGIRMRLVLNGFDTVGLLLKAERSKMQSVKGIGDKQIEIIETELIRYVEKGNNNNYYRKVSGFEKSLPEDNDERMYFQIFNVDPEEYKNIELSALKLKPGFIARLNNSGYDDIASLLRSKRSRLFRLKGIGEKYISELEKELMALLDVRIENVNIFNIRESSANQIVNYKAQILNGDFSFKQNIDEKLLSIIEKYEAAYEDLGQEIVSDIINAPYKYLEISLMLKQISWQYYYYRLSLEKAFDALKNVPHNLLTKPAYSFIRASLSFSNASELFKIADMKKCTLGALPYILNMNMRKEADLITSLYLKCNFNISELINKIASELNNDENLKNVLYMRSRGNTLEQIGQQYHKTRERVRQIESRARRIFSKWDLHTRIMLKISAILDSKEVLFSKEILPILDDNEEILYLLKVTEQTYYSYISKFDLFVLCDKALLDNALNIVSGFPDFIDKEFIEKSSKEAYEENSISKELLVVAIEHAYKKAGSVYYKSQLNSGKIYSYVIQKYYPQGIQIYDNNIMNEFKMRIHEIFGNVDISSNDRAIRARIMDNCIMCGKGKYKVNDGTTIPSRLLSEIKAYIKNNDSSVIMINSLFTTFKDHLLLNGIDNRYYMQALLKEKLSFYYSFTKDYIFKDGIIGSFYQEIISYIKKFDHPITKKQIIDHFPGITEIVLGIAVSDENIINLFGEYLHGGNLKLNDEDIAYLNQVIKKTVKDRKSHHAKDLFEIVSRENSVLLNKAGIFNAYSLFSVVEYLFRNEYQFSRPFYALNTVYITKPLEVIAEYVQEHELINIKDLISYAKEKRYQIYSILELINSYNESHLLINSEFIATLNYIGINETIAKTVEDSIIDDLSTTTLISNLSSLRKLPKLNVPWTDWLLYSILLKWGKKTSVAVTNKYFNYAHPVIALKGKIDISHIAIDEISEANNSEFKIDDLDNIDDLIADALDEELFEE